MNPATVHSPGLAIVTGASAGLGEAIAIVLGEKRWRLALGARRADRLQVVARQAREAGAPQALALELDVTDRESIKAFVARVREELGLADVLVNNAGLARGVEKVAEAHGSAWREMIETNVFGVLHMTREVLPDMLARGHGHVVMIGSIAGRRAYAGGSVYGASKRAIQSICEALRLETLGRGVRVTNVEPGLVETEFSMVRFSGDAARAKKVYENIKPLTGRDIAECVAFAIERPAHVNIDSMLVMPTEQAAPGVDVRGLPRK